MSPDNGITASLHPSWLDSAPAGLEPADGTPRPAAALTQQTFTLVLAGGRGTRLGPLTAHRAKPALPFAGQMAIIDFALSNCMHSGLRRIAVLTQYKAQSLIRHIERGWHFLDINLGEFIELVPAQQQVDEGWYSGTADAVYQNLHLLREARAQRVLVLAGDHAYKMDYARLLADHAASGAAATVACVDVPLRDASEFGVFSIGSDGRATRFAEKPADPVALPDAADRARVSMGIYVFEAAFLIALLQRDASDTASAHDFGHNLLPQLLASGQLHLHRFEHSCVGAPARSASGGERPPLPYWRDVGTVDAYFDAHMDLLSPTPGLDLHDEAWPILSLQRQLPPARFVHGSQGQAGTAEDTLVASGCMVRGARVRQSVLFSKVSVDEGSVVEHSLLLPGVTVGRGVRLLRVIVDKRCVLPDGLQVGLDAEEDARRFHISPSGVVLVTPEHLAALAPPAHPQAGPVTPAVRPPEAPSTPSAPSAPSLPGLSSPKAPGSVAGRGPAAGTGRSGPQVATG